MRHDRDTVVRRLAMTGVVISATVLSYSTLHHRAVTIGIPEWSAWFYPILYDAFILGASRTWQNQTLSDPTRKLAKIATLGGIAAAIGAFIAEFWPKGIGAVAFSLIIPAVMAASLVLTSRAAADRKTRAETSAAPRKPRPKVDVLPAAEKPAEAATEPVRPAPVTTVGSEPTEVPTKQLTPVKYATPEEIENWINEQLDAGVDLTGAMARARFPQLKGNASRKVTAVKARRESRNGHSVLAEEVKA